ncbi:MAG: methylenetetrahydrofolate reductase [Evtepia gabavorous]
MKLKDVWKKKEVTLSFEAFPPKKDSDFASVASAVEKIAQLKPDFMSVTYGAGGGTSAYTGKIAQIVQAQGVTALAHLTCVSSDRDRIHHELDALCQAGIENILALRGTTPRAMIRRPPGLPLCPGPGGGDSGLWWVFHRRGLLSRGACGVPQSEGRTCAT